MAGQKSSQTNYVRPKQGEVLTLGSIFWVWQGMPTFSIITVPASPHLEEVRNDKKRKPLILEGDNAAAWLLPDLSKEEMTNLSDDSFSGSFQARSFSGQGWDAEYKS